jgi:hypothetical protein
MTLKDDMLTDLDVLIDTDDFAVSITYNSATINGIFDKEFAQTAEGEVAIESTVPQVLVKDSDIVGAAHGDVMTINGINYNIIGIQPDGTGSTLILLSQD